MRIELTNRQLCKLFLFGSQSWVRGERGHKLRSVRVYADYGCEIGFFESWEEVPFDFFWEYCNKVSNKTSSHTFNIETGIFFFTGGFNSIPIKRLGIFCTGCWLDHWIIPQPYISYVYCDRYVYLYIFTDSGLQYLVPNALPIMLFYCALHVYLTLTEWEVEQQ